MPRGLPRAWPIPSTTRCGRHSPARRRTSPSATAGRCGSRRTSSCRFAAVADYPPALGRPRRGGGGGRDGRRAGGTPEEPPPGWELPLGAIPGVQMDGAGLDVTADPEAVRLGPSQTSPRCSTSSLARSPGRSCPGRSRSAPISASGAAARSSRWAGERMRPPGWSEISAVCTDPAHRGQGLAGRLVRAVGAVIRERGDVPFLHAAASNAAGIRLYEELGFTLRRELLFAALRAPRRRWATSPRRSRRRRRGRGAGGCSKVALLPAIQLEQGHHAAIPGAADDLRGTRSASSPPGPRSPISPRARRRLLR